MCAKVAKACGAHLGFVRRDGREHHAESTTTVRQEGIRSASHPQTEIQANRAMFRERERECVCVCDTPFACRGQLLEHVLWITRFDEFLCKCLSDSPESTRRPRRREQFYKMQKKQRRSAGGPWRRAMVREGEWSFS
jgi:hypothetical protein